MAKRNDCQQDPSASMPTPAETTTAAQLAPLAAEATTVAPATIAVASADASVPEAQPPSPLKVEAPRVDLDKITPLVAAALAETPSSAGVAQQTFAGDAPLPSRQPNTHVRRYALLAAAIALVAAVGAMAGSRGSFSLARVAGTAGVAANPATADEIRALRSAIAGLERDLASLKINVENSGKTVSAQLAHMTERLDRTERTQGEPAAKLAKISEAVERLERRGSTTAASDITGSIAAARPSVPEASPPAKPAVVEGWVLRRVYDGAALVQGRYGLIEIEPGDKLPGLGRVETIKRQDGRWVVVTPKGLIVTR
jgi:hypothetical protein